MTTCYPIPCDDDSVEEAWVDTGKKWWFEKCCGRMMSKLIKKKLRTCSKCKNTRADWNGIYAVCRTCNRNIDKNCYGD